MNVVSPSSKTQHLLAKVAGRALLWSRDGTTIYTVAPRPEGGAQLVSVDVRAGGVKSVSDLDPDVQFGTPTFPGQRFTLSPDGKSFPATIRRIRMDLWLLEGFDTRKAPLDWFYSADRAR